MIEDFIYLNGRAILTKSSKSLVSIVNIRLTFGVCIH